jgi:hypothetical protein
MKDTILSIIRHGLTFAGGYLAAKGFITSDTANGLVTALIPAVGVIWGAIDEYLAAKKAKAAA